MKKVVIGAMAVLALTACSNEEVIQTNEQNQEITFTAVTDKATSRAADGYCNQHKPGTINVWAKVGNKNYFANESYTESSGSYKIDGGVTRYWPESSSVDFFSAVNHSSITWDATSTTPAIMKDFTVAKTVSAQKDFIYAVATNVAKPSGGAAANLNFRHGLSQIVFKAQNKNKNIYVEIEGVSVCEAKNKGTFTFPTESTTENIKDTDHQNPFDPTIPATAKWGEWNLTGSTFDDYIVTFDPVGLNANQAESQSLTYANPAAQEWNSNTMYLMPQKFTSTDLWDPKAAAYVKPGVTDGKAYFLVKAKIWNIATPNSGDAILGGCNKTDDIVLWGTGGAKDIAIPIPTDTEWLQGKKYIYTFIFTKTGEGGYDPTTDEPTYVFTPITLSVTVDDFAEEKNTDVDMKKPTIP